MHSKVGEVSEDSGVRVLSDVNAAFVDGFRDSWRGEGEQGSPEDVLMQVVAEAEDIAGYALILAEYAIDLQEGLNADPDRFVDRIRARALGVVDLVHAKNETYCNHVDALSTFRFDGIRQVLSRISEKLSRASGLSKCLGSE